MNKTMTIICLFLAVSSIFAGPTTSLVRKIASESVEAAAKKSGKVLTPAMRKASEKALIQASKQYGDDVFKAVSRGGLEALEQGSKHGAIFWKLCAQSPKAARSLALHADDLIPIAKRIGPDFLKLEAHVPGLGTKAVTCFGDDAIKMIAKMPADDAAKLIKFGAKADSSKTAKLLLDGCAKSSGRILEHLDGKRIVALGLSASMVTAAYKVSNGVENSLTEMASNSPEHFTKAVSRPVIIAVICGAVILVWLVWPTRQWLARRLATKHAAAQSSTTNKI